jgi:hypothetical protein
VKGESDCFINPESALFYLRTPIKQTTFGFTNSGGSFAGASIMPGCSGPTYVWGSLDSSASPLITTFSGLGCNETIEAVDVNVTFKGPDLQIDLSVPPTPLEYSDHPSALVIWGGEFLYYHLLNSTTPAPRHLFDNFFTILTTSRYAISASSLADPLKADEVAAAIHRQHGIVRSQLMNSGYRIPAITANATIPNPPLSVADGNDARNYTASLFNSQGSPRVIQDHAATRILQGLLVASLLFSVIGWALMPQTGVLPRSPTSIVSIAALIAGGDLIEHFPSDHGETLGDSSHADRICQKGIRFGVGWKRPRGEEMSERFGIWVMTEYQAVAVNADQIT